MATLRAVLADALLVRQPSRYWNRTMIPEERCAKVAESFKCNEDDCKPGKGGIHSRVNENLDLAAMAIRSGKTGEGGQNG